MTVDLKESVAEIAVSQARELISPKAEEYTPVHVVYNVMHGMHEDNLEEDGSLEEYCEKCITSAVAERRREYMRDRQLFMGKIYEFSKHGYTTGIEFLNNKDGTCKGTKLYRDQKPEFMSIEETVKGLEKRLKKEFSLRRIFTSEWRNTDMEVDSFRGCENCGVLFDYPLIITDEELSYWDDDEKDLHASIDDPEEAYRLLKILDSFYKLDTEKDHKIASIAARIISKR